MALSPSSLEFEVKDTLTGTLDGSLDTLYLTETSNYDPSWLDTFLNDGIGNGSDFHYPEIVPPTVATDVASKLTARQAELNINPTQPLAIHSTPYDTLHAATTPPR